MFTDVVGRRTTVGNDGGPGGFAYGGTVGMMGAAAGMAGGGTVRGPGTSKSDSIFAMLSAGEEVIQEPYASMHRDLLKDINAGRFNAYEHLTYAPVAPSESQPSIDISGLIASHNLTNHLLREVRDKVGLTIPVPAIQGPMSASNVGNTVRGA